MAETRESVGRSNRSRLRALAGDLEVGDLTVEEFEATEFERIKFSMYLALVAETIPRRLGKDASPLMLALDKRIARKVSNLYRSLWMAVEEGAPPANMTHEDRRRLAGTAELGPRRTGATVRWGGWLKMRHDELAGLAQTAAALAVRSGRLKWGVRRVRLLTQERENVARIINDVVERRNK